MDDHLHPFSEHPTCVMCRYTGIELKYSEYITFRSPDGFINAHQHGSKSVPHLLVTCRRCGYQWLMQTAEGR